MTAPLPASFRSDVRLQADDLRARRVPFVAATVVRAERPTSAKPGDSALVLSDGTIVGFVGGECAEASVKLHALKALSDGEAVLLRITPDRADDRAAWPGDEPGVTTVHNPCLSGGTLEIFLEPENPPPLVLVHGDGPIARAVVAMAETLGYAVSGTDGFPGGAVAVVVASHGRGEAEILRAALEEGVDYVGLVASRRRGDDVLTSLDITDEERARIRTPAGLDIGARTPQEVALSILAEIVATRPPVRSGLGALSAEPNMQAQASGGAPGSTGGAPGSTGGATAADPVCGMAVAAAESTLHADHGGTRYHFCGSGCRAAFVADPAAFVRR
jgi:xanthine dehydrogenase accessory factor